MRRIVMAGFALLLAANAMAQTDSAPVKGMAGTVGLTSIPGTIRPARSN